PHLQSFPTRRSSDLRRVGELFLEHRPTHPGRPPKPVATAAPVQAAKPYEIAISFAGENRQFVGDVARELDSKGVRVFYDEFERVDRKSTRLNSSHQI